MVAIVPAAGIGKRFGEDINKQFHMLSNKPVLVWALEVLEEVECIKEIIPVLKDEDMETGAELIDEYRLDRIRRIAPGGKERQDSVWNGLNLVEDKDCIVLIHDGVRPLIEKKLVEDVISAMSGCLLLQQEYAGVVPVTPVKDTIKEVDGELIRATLQRDSLRAVQTPQVFPFQVLFAAYDRAMKEGYYATDDAALVEHYGGKVKAVQGSYRNIKITTPEDLTYAEFLLGRLL